MSSQLITNEDGRHRWLVDGAPFLLLGGQVRNSSTSPRDLAAVWPQALELGANSVEVPIAWDRFEPTEGEFNFEVVDVPVMGAREHGLRLVMLWFGTWKNGTMDYTPSWIKTDRARFPRMRNAAGDETRVLCPHSDENLSADMTAFRALMRRLHEIDGDHGTVIMVQVENEPGSLFTDRDYCELGNKAFSEPVPAVLAPETPGSWNDIYGSGAAEACNGYHIATYVDQIAAAGRIEHDVPLAVNVWLRERKSWQRPGEQYPSGGATANMLDLWKRAAPNIDVIAPDIYVRDHAAFSAVCASYGRPDNPLLVPESLGFDHFVTFPFLAIGNHDGVGIATFAFNDPQGGDLEERYSDAAANYRMLGPAAALFDELRGTGRVKAAVEQPHIGTELLSFERDEVLVQWGPIQNWYGGEYALGTESGHGRVIVAQSEDDVFFVMGFDTRVSFRPAPGRGVSTEFLAVERGTWRGGNWGPHGTWNGDETFFGLRLPPWGETLRVVIHRR